MTGQKNKNKSRRLKKTKYILPESEQISQKISDRKTKEPVPPDSDIDDEATRVTKLKINPLSQKTQNTGYIVIIYPPEAGLGKKVEIPLLGKVTVGRHPECTLSLNIDSVSRRHAEISHNKNNEFTVRDLGSTNGTYLNDRPIRRSRILRNGDRLRVGTVLLKFLSGNDLEAMYHEDVYKLTIMDALTNTYNRRYLIDRMKQEFELAKRRKTEIAFVMIDIDHFKRLNDTFGHLVGDLVLHEVSKRIQSTVRSGEIFARYGGEEFSILLPDATIEDAVELAERARAIVAGVPFEAEGNSIPVTISLGVSSVDLSKKPDFTPDELIAQADAKLYDAKDSGRNTVKY